MWVEIVLFLPFIVYSHILSLVYAFTETKNRYFRNIKVEHDNDESSITCKQRSLGQGIFASSKEIAFKNKRIYDTNTNHVVSTEN